jgi:ATP-binding cassette subfamily B protein
MKEKSSRLTDWRLLSQLVPYLLKYKSTFGVVLVLLVPLAIANAVQPLIIGQAISLIKGETTWQLLASKSVIDGLNVLTLVLLLTLVLRSMLTAWQGYLIQEIGQKITADIRTDLFKHVTSLAIEFFDRTPVGKLITRLTNDVEALGEVFASGAVGIISDLFATIAIVVLMLRTQWQLAVVLLLLLLPVTAVTIFFQQQFRKANYLAREELSTMNALLQENIAGIGVVQTFRREKVNSDRYRILGQKYLKQIDRTNFYDSAISATLEWVSLVAIAGVLWAGSQLIIGRKVELGVLSAFVIFAQQLFEPLRQFAEKFTAIQAGLTAIERVSEIFQEPIAIRDAKEQTSIRNAANRPGEIRFEDVWFAYNEDDYVIQALNFTINPGEKIALVGPTGAGKSSIIRLLCRLYEPTRGRILIDGIDIRDIPQKELRQYLGIILQDGFLFAGDVNSNITLGEKFSSTEIQAAAKATNVDRFLSELPAGYHTQLRQRGANLSSGQKQLLAFARVAIRNPHVLVLDEATANLDVVTEADIQAALDRLLVDRTAIVIAHRLSTIRNVDRIFVLKRGTLAETGTHQELLAADGIYASLHRLQMLGT